MKTKICLLTLFISGLAFSAPKKKKIIDLGTLENITGENRRPMIEYLNAKQTVEKAAEALVLSEILGGPKDPQQSVFVAKLKKKKDSDKKKLTKLTSDVLGE